MTAQPRHISIGQLGEQIVAGYLYRHDFHIVERNHRKKWGELDIVAKKDGVLHFVEVKAGTWNAEAWPQDGMEAYRPQDHMHTQKRARMGRVIRTYLAEKHVPETQAWSVDLAVVLINEHTRKARVRWLWGLVL